MEPRLNFKILENLYVDVITMPIGSVYTITVCSGFVILLN